MTASGQLSLTSEWFVKPGCEKAAMAALTQLASDVHLHEPDTLTYLVHAPHTGDARVESLPPANPRSILFFEVYRDVEAFLRHVNGPVYTGFVKQHGALFTGSNGQPYVTVRFLNLHAGFSRPQTTVTDNHHPAVMFEVIAKDQSAITRFYTEVFGWQYQTGTGNFAYIHFPPSNPPLLGGIGQADPNIPGFEPGHNFYLLVDKVEPVIARALAAGAQPLMPPTQIDGYSFAMFRDPEGNPVGLIEPFGASTNATTSQSSVKGQHELS